jgi:hypothetical protein
VEAQTAVLTETGSTCSALTVTMTGGCSSFVGLGIQGNDGSWTFSSYEQKKYRVTLFKRASLNLFFPYEPAFDVSVGSTYTWNNLPQGDYRVSTSVYLCTTQKAFSGGQLLGFRGVISPGATSNVAGVGETKLSDNVSNFLDANGVKIFPDANGNSNFFQDGEVVRINTTASRNFDRFFMAIFEDLPNGSPGRWRALGNSGNGGWINGPMNPIVNLTNLWNIDDRDLTYKFEPGHTYRLQIALSKNNCPSWTEVMSSFYICPSGWGCRTGGEKKTSNKIVLSPNPASNKFRLDGINFADTKACDVFVSDISGREIQRFKNVDTNEFALNGLSNGIYIVHVTSDNRRLFSSKLVVNN